MTASSATKRTGASRVFLAIAILVLVLIATLTGAWFYLANRLEGAVREATEAAAGGGTTIACENQDVFGYPFRLGLRCAAVGIETPSKGIRASAGALRTAAQIYDPTRIVAELDAPLLLEAPDLPPLDIRWTLLQASSHVVSGGVDRLALVVEAPDVAVVEPGATRAPWLSSDHLEVHARRNGEDLDFALSDTKVRAARPELANLPLFDLSVDLSVAGAANWLNGERPGNTLGEALRGRSGTLRMAELAFAPPATGAATLSGPFSVDDEGRLSGRFDIALSDPEAIADLAGRLVPGAEGVAGTLASGLGLLGRRENGRTVVTVEVRNGRASLGFLSLGRIPPIE